jgi:antitoxin ParD1/3/4/toxin ParE1/3/4
MSGFVLTAPAEQDLTDIWDYIAADNLDAADRVLDAFASAFERLAERPEIGHYREDLSDTSLRFHSVYSCLIVYRWEPQPLRIIRVLHGARDVRAILGESG